MDKRNKVVASRVDRGLHQTVSIDKDKADAKTNSWREEEGEEVEVG